VDHVSRIRKIALAAVACLALGASLAVASGGKPELQLHATRLGNILVNNRGYTVYAFSLDKRNKDVCQTIIACLTEWPAVRPGAVLAGPGVKKSLIGTIKLTHGGGKQLTYNGWPLYTYVDDFSPHQTSNVNILQFDGRWPALNAKGKLVK
jgi:predicted lipoprotein with Yx(FWY)xxD motif